MIIVDNEERLYGFIDVENLNVDLRNLINNGVFVMKIYKFNRYENGINNIFDYEHVEILNRPVIKNKYISSVIRNHPEWE